MPGPGKSQSQHVSEGQRQDHHGHRVRPVVFRDNGQGRGYDCQDISHASKLKHCQVINILNTNPINIQQREVSMVVTKINCKDKRVGE